MSTLPSPASDATPAAGGAQAAWRRWRGRLATFAAGQSAVQALALVTGLLMMRWMPEEEYAKAGLVLGFQILFGAFVDLGVGGALLAVIGPRGHDPAVVGEVIAAARWWRRALLAVVLPLGAAAFLLLHLRQGWDLREGLLLYGCIAASLFAAGLNAWASAPLLIHHRLPVFYGLATASALARLCGCWLLFRAEWLDAVSAALLGTAVSTVGAQAAWRAARRHVVEPERSSTAWRDELRRSVAPQLPSTLFYAVQGQLTTFLIAWFGQAQHMAEVTALGRLGQVFAFLSAAFSTLVMPTCARLDDAAFARRYPWIVGGTLAFAALVSGVGFVFPQPLLWLLGPRYQHLQAEVGWMVAAAAVAFAGGAIWMVHAARRWVFWSASALYIGSVTLVQVGVVVWLDMGVTLHVVLLGLATNVAALAVQAWTARLGFRRAQASATGTAGPAASRASTEA